jgi:chromate transporter
MDLTLIAQIFWVFTRITFLSFGGVFAVLPELERMVVREHGWITSEAFAQSYALSQFIPGPNMAMCPLIGYWVAGWPGWVAGFLGIYLGPLLIMGGAHALLRRYTDVVWVRRLQLGLQAITIGLLAASAMRMFWIQTAAAGELSAANAWLVRGLAFAVCAAGAGAYAQRRMGALSLVFVTGGLWWALNRGINLL